jgi:hypothetical protein
MWILPTSDLESNTHEIRRSMAQPIAMQAMRSAEENETYKTRNGQLKFARPDTL